MAGESFAKSIPAIIMSGRLHKLGVTIRTHARLFGMDEDTAYFQDTLTEDPILLESVDTLVLSLGHIAVDTLKTALADREIEQWDHRRLCRAAHGGRGGFRRIEGRMGTMNKAGLITGGEAVYRVLRDHGVKTVFGLLGGSMLELYDSMYAGGEIAYVGARDERAAGHMADAYARVDGGPGIVLGAQAGPGVVNLTTAVAEAHLAYSPLVVLAGAISRTDLGKDTFQEIDQVALFAPISKRSILVTEPSRLAEMVRDAIRLAMSGRRGPVVLHIPRDLFSARVPPPVPGPVTIARPGPAAPDDVAQILTLLAQSCARLLWPEAA